MWWFSKRRRVDILEAGWLQGMVDIHCHLLPNVDDGSQSPAETQQLLTYMHSVGIREVITTPHVYCRYPDNNFESLHRRYSSLLEEVSALQHTPLHLAGEYMMDEGFEARIQEPLLTLGSSQCLLMETSYVGAPIQLYDFIFQVLSRGVIPVIAHPERYLYMEYDEYNRLRNAGCLFQMNLFSLTGLYGEHVRKRSEYLLEASAYSFIGTDLHRAKSWERIRKSAVTLAKYEEPVRTLISSNARLLESSF